MNMVRHQGGRVILLTFITALILAMIPLPSWLEILRPEWVTLVLIYWCMALPQRVGVGVGWLAGLLLDVVTGSLLGLHALALSLTAFLALRLHQRVRVFPVWQQALTILILVALQQLLVLWIKGIINQTPQTLTYWLPSLASTLVWPAVFITLRAVRRRYHVR
jgi:rod shape-determining protein MreD